MQGLFFCFSGFSVGCGRRCIQNVTVSKTHHSQCVGIGFMSQVSQCCDGFYGTDCLPCQENHVSPCSGNGQVCSIIYMTCVSDFLCSVLMALMGMALAYVMTPLLAAFVKFVLDLTCLGRIVLKVCYSNDTMCILITLFVVVVECTCINGICDEGPLGSGQCLTGSCNVGFTGDNCDIGVPHCGFLNDTCHVNAICQVVNNAEEYVTMYSNRSLISYN